MDDGSLLVAICTLVMTAAFGLIAWLLKREINRYDSRRKQDIAWKAWMHRRVQECEWKLKITPSHTDILPIPPPDDSMTEESA